MDVWQPAYPVTEYGGLVFVYMGPPGAEPLFPRFDIIDPDRGEDIVLRGMRLWGDYAVGMVKDCNWLQHYENIVDPHHLLMLHQWISGDQFDGALMQGKATIGWEKTSLGVRYNLIKDLPNGNRMVRHAECIVPNMFIIPSIREPGTAPKRKQRGTELSWVVPIDNEHVRGISIVAWRSRMARPSSIGSPGPTPSPTFGRARSWNAATRSDSENPTISKRKRGSARSRSKHSKTWHIRTPASACSGSFCASNCSVSSKASTRSTSFATPRRTSESRPAPGTRSCRRPKPPHCHTAKTSDAAQSEQRLEGEEAHNRAQRQRPVETEL
jgi:phenylpropionate dioxygenase-like ring-hydroxylating dioxygenase large terminal subunit